MKFYIKKPHHLHRRYGSTTYWMCIYTPECAVLFFWLLYVYDFIYISVIMFLDGNIDDDRS